MYKDKKILAIIPARGGSKRLPRKNILPLAGKPLIAWTIEAAKESAVFSEIMVNTDDQEIAGVANEHGANIPFFRSLELGSDTASSLDVVMDTLNWYKENGTVFDIVILLQPTSPLRNANDIIQAVDLFLEKDASSVLSVCEVDHPVQWANTLDDSLSMDNFIRDEAKGKRSQDLDVNFRLNGAIYVWNVEELLLKNENILKPAFAYVMPRNRSVDIDDDIDLKFAELICKTDES